MLLVVFFFLPALLLTWYTLGQQNQLANEKARQDALRLAQLSAASQDQMIVGGQQLLIALAQIAAVRAGNTAICDPLFARMHEQFPAYTNIFMVDTNGDTICSGLPVDRPFNVRDRAWFQRAMQVRTFSVGDFAVGAFTGLPVVTLSYPIFEDNRLIYQLGLSLDLRRVGDQLANALLPRNTTITAIDRHGIVLYRYPNDENVIGQPHWNSAFVQAIFDQQTGTLEGVGYDGIERLYGFVPLDTANGSAYIMVGISKAVALAEANALFLQNILVLSVVGFISLAVAFIGARVMVVQPTQLLVNSSNRLAAGDLTTRIELRQFDHTHELYQLASAFNHMAEALQRRQADLQQSNMELANEIIERKKVEQALQQARDGLEVTVQERTAELVFLSEASKTLASNLDYTASLQRVVELAVPSLADGCAITLLEDTATVSLSAGERALVPDVFAQHILQTDEALCVPDLQAWLAEYQITAAAPTAAVGVPIKVQGQVAGAITLGAASRIYDPTSLGLLEDLARRIASAVDNARLYQQVHEQREHLLVTLGSIGDGVIATDEQGCITFMNPIAQALTGWDEADAIGQPLAEVFQITHETTHEPVENPALKALAEGRIIDLSNHTILTARNGIKRPIDDSGAPIWGADRSILGSILVFRDITERRQRELAEREQRVLSEALRDTALILTSTLHLSEVLDRILANVGQVVPHDTADVMFIEDGEARIVRSRGYSQWGMTLQDVKFAIADTSTLRQMLETQQPILIPDVRQYAAWVSLPQTEFMRSYMGVPIILQSEIIGFLNLTSTTVDYFTPVQADHLQAFAAQAAIAIQNAQLFEQAQTLAVMEERQRLAYDLHDAVSQMLFSSSLLSESLPRLWRRRPERVEAQLEQLTRLNWGAHAELRNLLMELSPSNLLKTNMTELLRQLALAISARTNLKISTQVQGQHTFPPDVHMTLYRITQEALNNTVKHARATQVDISLITMNNTTVLRVKDNGRGFDVQRTPSRSMGLTIMRDRARAIGAALAIHSEAGSGTEIVVTWLNGS